MRKSEGGSGKGTYLDLSRQISYIIVNHTSCLLLLVNGAVRSAVTSAGEPMAHSKTTCARPFEVSLAFGVNGSLSLFVR